MHIESDDMKGLKEYYNENIGPINEELNKELGKYEQIKHIHIPMLKARIIDLINTVSLLPNVNFYLHLDSVIDYVAMKEIDLFAVINIFIDNAIEETKTQEKGKITIEMTQTNDRFIFQIKNTLNGYESTHKPNNTHRGNEIARDIMCKYPNMASSTRVEYGSYIKILKIMNT